MRASTVLSMRLGALAPVARGATLNMFVGNLVPPASIYSLEFDDETNDFKVLRNNTAHSSHAWIAFDHAKENIYGSSLNTSTLANYRVLNETTIELTHSITATGSCTNTTSPFVTAMSSEPYLVFSASWPDPNACAMSLSTSRTGAVDRVLDTWSYINTSGIHGLALSPTPQRNPPHHNRTGHRQQLIYSADLNGDFLWTHSIDLATGRAAEVARFAVSPGTHPRHLAVHPNGERLYAVHESANSVAEYALDEATGAVRAEVVSHPLIPPGVDPERYWSAEVMLGPPGATVAGGRYLWATARARDDDAVGYVSVFLVGADGGIVERMLRVPTTTRGEYAAMTDYPEGYVLLWKLDGRRERADGLVEYRNAMAVARADVGDGGCCANAIWYS
ncbi:Lactonase, 7-bladed beta-propeller-domain-containing protein [Corynascus novoguineensis]|uniref:Lactonase, 7-bladed beta-propeller-domain-containing protein n=1 Tax=Corynascus novoguineensis TaxID=1126955 RepID=A0AAN7HHJ1_9PEZI|nr:Lactonase, 7-bladed beta-propeller-domain-containing protein [Corynascus novoguineensis]